VRGLIASTSSTKWNWSSSANQTSYDELEAWSGTPKKSSNGWYSPTA
jgi:hypothetical protein